ncbi:MAG: hydrolase [Gemmatimonadetes bacterium]|jgi:nicotinamidase-related amidase|nr:hydrolase [Gemmatimonadota bacterium]MBT6148290.1 hydrolase [Gemmatimonadota bacterium]MBT7864308.1 hydrolase [Gemmatimonadota bacterium]
MLTVDKAAVVLIDVQGKLASLMFERDRLYQNLQILLQGARILELPILWLEQYPKGLGPTVPQIAGILDGLEPIAKTSFSACGEPRFIEALAATGRRQAIVAGIESHVCVYQTTRDLLASGHEVEIIADAVSSRTEANCRLGLKRMESMGASMSSVEMCLFELLREAGSEQFKQISRLVR